MKASMQHQELTYELQPLQKLKEQLNSLDHVVTEHEIRQAVKTLKKKKSPFVDGIRNEMIEASLESLMPVISNLLISFYNLEKCQTVGVKAF